MRVLHISSYTPRECGIASFCQSLIQAIEVSFGKEKIFENQIVVAVNDSDNLDEYAYQDEVKFIIRQDQQQDYIKAAEFINNSSADICVLQHEFGIYGGQSGLYVLSLLNRLTKPVVVVLHTVLKEPSHTQRIIIREIGRLTGGLVVMTKRSAEFLSTIYNIPIDKIHRIEHGVPDLTPPLVNPVKSDALFYRKKMLLTFGLINRGKGLETVIRALPQIVAKHPDVVYVVLGKTHPGIVKRYGEEYRDDLKTLAADLDVSKHLYFINKFATEQELINYLSASEIYITPYLNEAQSSSGSLSYAIGAGAATVSTPYWHAQELLDDNRGRLFNFRDSDGLAVVINDLLDHPQKLFDLKQNAYEYGQHLRWPRIGKEYVTLFAEVVNRTLSRKQKIHKAFGPATMPKFSLEHVVRLTDDTGIIQHAKYGIPNFKEGYCVDDNARAIIMTIMAYKQKRSPEALKLLTVYLSFMQYMQNEDGSFRNFLGFDRQYLDKTGSGDSFGRTVWALGYLIYNSPGNYYREFADELFRASVKHFKEQKSLRGIANTIIGVSYYLRVHPGSEEMFRLLTELTAILTGAFKDHQNAEWQWFEDQLTYDNAMLPLSLLHSCEITGDTEVKELALTSLRFLEDLTFEKGCLTPIGNDGWCLRKGKIAEYHQQAIEAMAMVLMYFQAYIVTKDSWHINRVFDSYLWFLGENSLHVPLYDEETKGCCDGLHPAGINRNQGAESTLAYLISHLTVLKAFEMQYDIELDTSLEQIKPYLQL